MGSANAAATEAEEAAEAAEAAPYMQAVHTTLLYEVKKPLDCT